MPLSPDTIETTVAKAYTIARLSKENIYDLARLHSEVYTPVAADHYLKKYDTAYTGVEYNGFIAYNLLHQPIAYYGVIPCIVQYDNKKILSAQSADTMTHPHYRYKGLFVELSEMTFDLCRQLNILLVFGFPNENSYHGAVNKLGWKLVNRMNCFSIPVNTFPFASFCYKKKFLKKLYNHYVAIVIRKHLSAHRSIENSVLNDGFAGVCRNKEYHLYKKNISRSTLIEIAAVKIWVSLRQILLVGDMEGINENNFNKVVDGLKKLSKKMGVKEIQFHCSPGTTLHQLFEKAYHASPSYPVLYQDFDSPVPPEKLRFTFADIDIF